VRIADGARNEHIDGTTKQRFQVLNQREIMLRIFTFGEDDLLAFLGPQPAVYGKAGSPFDRL
jgi:hypothetical protein